MAWPKGTPRPNRAPQRSAKTSQGVVGGWLQLIKAAVVERNAARIPGMSEDNFYRFAGSMLLIGDCDDPIALSVFDPFCQMLLARWWSTPQAGLVREEHPLKKGRIYFFENNHALLPVTRDGLLKVGAALKAAAEIEYVEHATFKVDAFVAVALALPDPEGYVEVSKTFGLSHRKIGTVFHPNTLEKWTGVYRGVLGPLADSEYSAAAIASIRTVR